MSMKIYVFMGVFTLILMAGSAFSTYLAVRNATLPTTAIDVRHVSPIYPSIRPGDDVVARFDYCNNNKISAKLIGVNLMSGGRIVAIEPASFLMPTTDVPLGCNEAVFRVFKLPTAMPEELKGGTARAELRFEIGISGTHIYQSFTTDDFTIGH